MATDDDLLFAEHAVRAGIVSGEAIEESMAVQRRMAEMGVRESLANVLVKRGVIKETDVLVVNRRAGIKSGRDPIPGYTLEKRIGSGAMGSVYLAFQKGMKRHVAVKVLRRDLTDDPRQVERLQREAELVGKLSHPNIVRGLDSGETGGMVWFVMEYVEGETLHAAIRRRGRIPLDEAIDVTRQLAEALKHAHGHGVVHRDVKPGNVLLTKDGLPRLTDYGLAKGESDDALTQVDATLGTPQYIAPEQAKNPRDADIRSDVYSLGATLYAMLAGRPPFSGATVAATLTKVLYQRPEPLHEAAPGVTPGAAYLVARMMAKDRGHRYETPDHLLQDLHALQRGKLHVPMGFRGDIVEYVETRRHRRQWLFAAAVIVCGAAAALGVTVWRDRQDTLRRQTDARARLAAILKVPGNPTEWTRGTVEGMVSSLERYLEDYAALPTRAPAVEAFDAWRGQAAALQKVNGLVQRFTGYEGRWPPRLAEYDRQLRLLRANPDATVAARELEALTARSRLKRDQAAKRVVVSAATQVADLTLERAAAIHAALPGRLDEQFFGPEPSETLNRARRTAARFHDADARMRTHFAVYDGAAADAGAWARGEYRRLLSILDDCRASAAEDPVLTDLFKDLPRTRGRQEEVRARYGPRRLRLTEACRRRERAVFDRVEKDVSERRFQKALASVIAFGSRAVGPSIPAADALADRIALLHDAARADLEDVVVQGVLRFFEALGSRTYAEARRGLDVVAQEGARWPETDNPAARLATGGRRLLDLVESRAWDRLRAHLRSGAPLPDGLKFGTIGLSPTKAAEGHLVGDEFVLRLGAGGEPVRYRLTDISLGHLVAYSGLDPEQPQDALVVAALELTEFRAPESPRGVRERMAKLEPHLVRAESLGDLAPMAAHLRDLRGRHVTLAELGARKAEEEATTRHEESRNAFREARFADVVRELDFLLHNDRMRVTRYVLGKRKELKSEMEAATDAREAQGYAAHFPGARLRRDVRGATALHLDFEDPESSRLLGLEPGITGLRQRTFLAPNLAGAGNGAPAVSALRRGAVLTWEPWNGEARTHPRRFPVAFDCPFEYRKPITVSFLYRSDAPYALFVSICGATAGVLSAPDDREGGLGARVWHADALTDLDGAFGDKHRPAAASDRRGAAELPAEESFGFEPGRVYRVRFVKSERRSTLFVDGRAVAWGETKATPTGKLAGRIALLSYTSGEVDDLRVEGVLDPKWKRRRK